MNAQLDAAAAEVNRCRKQLEIERAKLAQIEAQVTSAQATYPVGRVSREMIAYGQLFVGAKAATAFIQEEILPGLETKLAQAEQKLAALSNEVPAGPTAKAPSQ
jgi:hypothetical protein